MKVDVVPFRQISAALRQRWDELHASAAPPCDSPFYRPEFAAIVDAARGDVEVCVVERGGTIAALLPFHRLSGQIGKPVGLHLNDFQGLVGQVDESIDLGRALRKCGLKAWDFDHVPVEQGAIAGSIALSDLSPYIDLSAGLEAYESGRNAQSNELKDSARRLRKLEREHGAPRFDFLVSDTEVLEQMIAWKRGQFVRTTVPDVLNDAWSRETVAGMFAAREEKFSGVVSTLRVHDQLIAVEMGVRSGSVYHIQWIAYAPEFHNYSPGRLLGEQVVRWASQQGIRRVEYGKGDQEYKLRAANGHHVVGTGSIATGALQKAVRGTWWTMRRWARQSPWRKHLKAAATYYYRLRRSVPSVGVEGV